MIDTKDTSITDESFRQFSESSNQNFLEKQTTATQDLSTYNPEKQKSSDSNNLSVFDVVAYILSQTEQISTMKLQKLLYYCQAWALVWDEQPLFGEKIEAWANGPVVRKVFYQYQGKFMIENTTCGNGAILSKEQRETVDSILKHYGKFSAQQLIEMTHSEKPWIEARKGLADHERGAREIPLESLHEYYSSL